MDQLEMDGATIKDHEMVKEAVQKFYKNLQKETEQQRPDFRLQNVTRITKEEDVWLQRLYEEEEILECLNLCAKEKHGSDGLPMVFFETFWFC